MEELNKSAGTHELDDETLIEKFKNGDRGSFNMLAKRYQKRAVNYLYKLSRNFELAEDIAQMAFLTLYQKAALFHTGCRFRPWFYKILTNLYYYEMRKKKNFLQYSLDASYEFPNGTTVSLKETIASKAGTPLDELKEKEKRANMKKLIASLPHKQKAALVLYIYNGLNYKDIALTLGCSAGTVKSRIHYALRSLGEKVSQLKREGRI
ncbi:sigma-70 family RNA polymerase sigma factor [bacterium]|nr:sigma-70 family RNA polymerase sigma factor [bacterium]